MAEPAERLIEARAEAGDPAYATAYAILQLTAEVHSVAIALRHIGMDGPNMSMGALEFIGKQFERLADEAEAKE